MALAGIGTVPGRGGPTSAYRRQWDTYNQDQDAEAARSLQRLRSTVSAFGGGGEPGSAGSVDGSGMVSRSGGGGVMGGDGGITPGSSIPSIAPIDTTAADDASFARAKDVAGQTGRASLDSLRGLLGETGQLGGGAEVQATRDVVEHAAGQTGEVNREQAIQRSERAMQTALANQQAGVTQRGQDIAAKEAQARLALAQTQMQSQRSLELLRLALTQAASTPRGLY